MPVKIYKSHLIKETNMTAIHQAGKKREVKYNLDQNTYDEFVKACSRKGLAPQVLVEQAMKKFIQTGQI